MLSSTQKIGLLLVAHFVGGLLLAWIVRLDPRDVTFGLLFALISADLGLLATWGALSTVRFTWRIPAVLAATVYLRAVQNAAYGRIMSSFFQFVMTTVLILIVLSILRYGRRRLRLTRLTEDSPGREGFQFTIRHIMLATAVVAILLGLRQAIPGINMFLAFVVSTSFVVAIKLAMLWATLGTGRPALRLFVTVPTAVAAGAVSVFYAGVPSSVGLRWLIVPAIAGLQAILIAASLLVVRSCGWRLVSGGDVRAEPQPPPDDQGPATSDASR